jgi:clorobiocin/coumermycin A biosynthesis protein CloN6/CouN6
MENTSLINRINYSTKWLSRRDLVVTGYGAVRQLSEARARHGALASGLAASMCQRIDDSLAFLLLVDEIDNLPDPETRRRELAKVGGEIRRRNDQIFKGTVSNQAFPIQRQIGGRWFDEIPAFVDEMVPETASAARADASAATAPPEGAT